MPTALRNLRVFSLAILVSLLVSGCGEKSVSKGPHIEVRLVADQQSLTAGSSFRLGVHFKPEPGWHIYWRNPGDSGLAPRFAWESSGGVAVDAPLWPYPKKIAVGPLVNYGYDEVLLPFPATFSAPPPRATSTTVTVSMQYLVCKDECLPGEAQLELTLPISKTASAPSEYERLFAIAEKNIPTALERVSIAVEEQQDRIIVALIPLEPRFFPAAITFFPEDARVISNSAPQEVSLDSGALRVSLKRDPNRRDAIRRLRGVLYSPQGWSESGEPKAIEIDTNPEGDDSGDGQRSTRDANNTPTYAGGDTVGFFAAIFFAILGGLLLNIMPCVFPVLSIKILSFIEQAGHEPRKIKAHGIAFSAGVVVSFWIFAGTLLALRAGGEQLGWGFQLQSPAFVAAMIFILFALGFLFLSDIALGSSIQRIAGKAKISTTYAGSFFNGALATAVATPCTGPFMGSALAATLTLSAVENIFIFTALGVGMSLPYLLIAFKPALLQRLPRPGAWMESFKQLMAFPLFASVVWLARVFARQMGLEAAGLDLMTDLLWGLFTVGFAFWLVLRAREASSRLTQRALRALALTLFVVGFIKGLPSSKEVEGTRSRACLANEATTADPDKFGLIWEPYSESRLATLMAQGRSVYLDFTAEWCITCQVNEGIVFSSSDVRALIVQKNVALMKGDWTTKSPSITAALRRYGRNGVPLNVIINKGKQESAVVLPNILTPGIVIAELERL
jgi:thiol:disulfide interchange protein/DsbC/DsbD-like thiol-disulfide interchange protein